MLVRVLGVGTTTTTTASTAAGALPPVTPPVQTPPVQSPLPNLPRTGANSQTGIASWYEDQRGRCAHRTIAIGTSVTVVNLITGRSTTCTVTNRGPYSGARIIDLSKDTFAKIAPLAQGIADVRIEW